MKFFPLYQLRSEFLMIKFDKIQWNNGADLWAISISSKRRSNFWIVHLLDIHLLKWVYIQTFFGMRFLRLLWEITDHSTWKSIFLQVTLLDIFSYLRLNFLSCFSSIILIPSAFHCCYGSDEEIIWGGVYLCKAEAGHDSGWDQKGLA